MIGVFRCMLGMCKARISSCKNNVSDVHLKESTIFHVDTGTYLTMTSFKQEKAYAPQEIVFVCSTDPP
jgi:hypothetical protein